MCEREAATAPRDAASQGPPPARQAGERRTQSSPAPINDDGRETQCRVAAASDIVVAKNVVVLSSVRRAPKPTLAAISLGWTLQHRAERRSAVRNAGVLYYSLGYTVKCAIPHGH